MKKAEAEALLASKGIKEINSHTYFINIVNPKIIEALIILGLDPNSTYQLNRDGEEYHLLGLAYSRQEYKTFKVLIERGANPNIPNNNSVHKEPLIFQVASSAQKAPSLYLKAMVKHGVDLNVIHPVFGISILHWKASAENKLKTIQYLVRNGALINNPMVKGQSFLECVQKEYDKIVKYNFHWIVDESKEKLDYVLSNIKGKDIS